MKNNGKAAETAFENYWAGRGHVERLRDKKDLMGLNKGARIADFAKPSDFIVSSMMDGLHYAEVKSTVDPKRFSFKDIRPAQSAAAILEAKRGAKAYKFYIFSYYLGQWFVMDCIEYVELLEGGRRSVLFEELTQWQM